MAEEHSIKNLDHTLTHTDVPASDEEFSLEEILAEYGGSLEQQLLRQAEAGAEPKEAESPEEAPEPKQAEPPKEAEPTTAESPKETPPEPRQAEPPKETPETPKEAEPKEKEPLEETPPEAGETDITLEQILLEAARMREEAPPEAETERAPEVKRAELFRETPPERKTIELSGKTPPEVKTAEPPEKAPSKAKTTELPEKSPPEAKTAESPEKAPPKAETKRVPETGAGTPAVSREDADVLREPLSARSISIEEMVNSTVEAVMEEQAEEPILSPRRGLFSRRRMEDTEELPGPPEPEPEYVPEPIGPEPDLRDVAQDCRERYLSRKKSLLPPLLAALPPTAALLAERRGLTVPLWSGDPHFQSLALLACLGVTALLCRYVFLKAAVMLARRRCVSELLIAVSVLAAAADCVVRLRLEERSAVMPYAAIPCLALVFAQWGVRRESRGDYDMFRTAAMDDEPPYLVTDTQRGACKQRGSVPGFYTTAARDNAAVLWQTALLPVFGTAAFVFAGLSSFGQGRKADFFLNLSAILSAAGTFSLALCWPLPWSRLAGHLQKSGSAVAGWSGAQKISRKRCMIVTDSDLFPPGTIQLKAHRLYGEELGRAASLAASVARAAGCGLERFFDGLLRAEGGSYEEVEDFSFYEEGGYSGMIRGESVLMGTGPFLRKMGVRMPGDVNLRTGVFLAVDKTLIAVFAVKYNPSDNVDFALNMMRRSRILPILASRDPNITPALLRRKFSRGVRLEYPDLSERVALSEAENDRDLPRALLLREGLLPYAETVAGSLRLCRAVRWAAALSLLGSWAGTLLSFYLVSLGAYDLLNPLALEMFLLLWTLPVLLVSDWSGRY